MPTYAPIGSTALEDDTVQAATAKGLRDNVLTRSLRGGVYGAGSQLLSAGGGIADALGADEIGAALHQKSGGLRAQAALPENSPTISTFRQLRDDPSLSNAGEYVGGLLGGSAPVSAAALAGGLATGGAGVIPGILGAAAASAPFEVGDVVQRQQADPTAMQATPGARLRDALVSGGGSALLQGVIPGAVAGKVAGRTGSTLGGALRNNAMAIPGEAAAEGSGEVVKQLGANLDKPLDWEQVGENAIGGAAAGAPFAVAGAAGDFVHGNADKISGAATSIKERLAKKAEAVSESPLGQKVSSGWDDLKGLAEAGRQKVDDSVDRVMNGTPLGDLKAWAGAKGEQLTQMMQESDNETLKRAGAWAKEMMDDPGLSPETRQAVSEAMASGQAKTVATLRKVWEEGKEIGSKAKRFAESAAAFAKRGMDKFEAGRRARARADVDVDAHWADEPPADQKKLGGPKKSEDYSGFEKAIRDQIVPLLAKNQPRLVDNAEALNNLAAGLRQVMTELPRGPLSMETTFALIDLLGQDTVEVLRHLNTSLLKTDPGKTEAMFKSLVELDKTQKRYGSLKDQVMAALTEETQDTMKASEVGPLIERMVRIARGEGDRGTPAERELMNTKFRDELVRLFGPKADAISKAIEREAGLGREKDETSATEGDFDDDGNIIEAEELDVIRKGRGENNEPVMHPELFKANNEPGQNYAAQYMMDLAKEHPDRNVRFEYAEGSKTHGHVVAEKAADKDKLLLEDVKGMRLDTKKYPNSPNRIEIDTSTEFGAAGKKLILDSFRIASVMDRRLPYTEESQTRAERLAEMFKEGVARLVEKYGRFKIKDDVVIGQVAGKDITWGDAKKIKRTRAPNDIDGEERAELRDSKDEMAREPGKDAQIHEAAKTNAKGNDSPLFASGTKQLDAKGVAAEDVNTKPAPGLVQRANEDGSAHAPASGKAGKPRTQLLATFDDWRGSKAAETLAKRGKALYRVFDSLGKADQAALLALEGKPASEAAGTINRLFGQVKEVRALPKDGAAEPVAGKERDDGDKVLGEIEARDAGPVLPRGEPPNPKELAAKKAALLKAASSSDPALLKELATTSDAKALQRAIEALPPGAALDAANARMAELVQDPDVAYGLQTKKYSMQSTDADRAKGKWAKAATLVDDLTGRLGRRQADADAEFAKARGAEAKGKPAELVKALREQAEYLQRLADETKAELQSAEKELQALPRPSAQSTNPNTTWGTGSRPDIKAYIERVLGKSVKLAWAKFTHAGEYSHAVGQGIIRLSVHALDPLSTAHHEALHAFIAQLKDAGANDIVAVLEKAASTRHWIERLHAHFANEPGVLAQLKDPEERAAYMYQLWAANQLTVSPQVRSVFGKLADLVRKALGLWSNDERALHILDYFHSGQYAKAGSNFQVRHALMSPGRNKAYEAAVRLVEPLARVADALASTGDARLRDTEIPGLIEIADAIKRETTSEGGDQGFIPAARIEATKRRQALGQLLSKYTEDQLKDAMEGLQSKQAPLSPEARLAARAIKTFLRETRQYMVDAGANVGDLGPDYFPRVWDTHYISKNRAAFKSMLTPYQASGQFTGDIDEFINELTSHDGNEFGIETRRPGMQFTKKRVLDFLVPADTAPFLNKDLLGTLNSYITQATRRAEWDRRLGGGKIDEMLERAKAEGASKDQLQMTEKYLKGVDGTLGDSLNPELRRWMGNMIVYQNIRLLPLAMFSSIVDPMGVMVRGGTVSDAWKTFKRGMAAIPATFSKTPGTDEGTRLAELVGVVDNAMLSHVMGDLYTQGMVGGTAQKINNAFFKYNFMEGLNRGFRIGATEAALSFIARHADGTASAHSPRWMKELGLTAADVKMVNGRMALTEAEGLTAEQVVRVHAAINQWVDGAVLRPDAADKPIWMNDPHYALISHLKQFVFSFQKTILNRVVHEVEHGNIMPVMALASYVPVMLAADFLKGMLQSGGGEPEWKKNWGAGEYLGYAVERAGLYGVGQFGVDVVQDVQRGGTGAGALVGPTIEQLADAVQTLGGRKQFGATVLDALPANALYSEMASTGG